MNYKKIIALFCFILFLSVVGNHDIANATNNTESKVVAKNVNSEKYVNIEGSLIMRDAPDSQGKKVTMLKNGSKVFVYTTDENGWSYVKQGKFKGYVKDSFLTTKSKTSSNSSNKATKTRVIDFSMSINQVKKMEPAKLNKEIIENNITVLNYVVEKYGYYSLLEYYFIDGKLNYIVYDFLPDKDSYNTWNEMSAMFNTLDKEAIKEFGEGVFVTDKYSSMSRMWKKDNYEVLLIVDDEDYYTEARLIIHKLGW